MGLLAALKSSVDVSALIIAAIGALFSIASALYLTSRKISAEFRFRRADLSNTYAENILGRRLELYPELWRHLSGYAKIARQLPAADGVKTAVDVNSLRQLHADISAWDSNNGLIMSANTANSCYAFRADLRRILEAHGGNAGSQALTKEERDLIIGHLARLEVALRTDIGIYEVEEFEGRRIVRGYRDIAGQADWASGEK
jgi:hypothetical protein